jgi:putative ABC transport system permease protein
VRNLIVLVRTLRRDKLYAAINIGGLSLGIACCLLLALFLRSELTYDQHNVLHQRIYRVVAEYDSHSFAFTSPALGPMLAQDYPGVQAAVRFMPVYLCAGNHLLLDACVLCG